MNSVGLPPTNDFIQYYTFANNLHTTHKANRPKIPCIDGIILFWELTPKRKH